MMQYIAIPDLFFRRPFFGNGERKVGYDETTAFTEIMRHAYFVYDIAAVQLVELYKPWENPEEAISAVFSLWKEAKQEIALLLRQRKRREAEEPMIHFTAHFLSVLHWMNGVGVSSLQDMDQNMWHLPVKPINVGERILFILDGPSHYHSFIQLSELYEEAEKQFLKQMVVKKTRLKRKKTSPL